MKKFLVKREIVSNKAILGILLDETKELARSLENPYRNTKKDSAIPLGIYKCKRDYTGKFQYWKVLDVPGRENIEIHPGNTEKDTEGCILLGEKWDIMNNELAIINSKATLEKLKSILPEEFELEIKGV